MKRFLTTMAVIATIISVGSCQKSKEDPSLDFSKSLYTVFAKGSAEITVLTSEAPQGELIVPLKFSGTAVKDEDYKVSSESVKIAAGELSGSVSITNVALSEEKTLTVTFEAPSGYKAGNKFSAVIASDQQEALIYSFRTAENVVLESYEAGINLIGTENGKDFKAQTDLSIPILVKGAGETALDYEPVVKIKAGESKGTIKFKIKDPAFSGNLPVKVSVNTDEAPRFNGGDIPELLLNVRGQQTPDKLVGTWKFVRAMDLPEIEEWYKESEDDVSLLPTHNEGFTLTFSKEGDGSVKLVPNKSGDFANYFTEAVVTLTIPVNPCSKAIMLGKNTTEENNMYVAADNKDGSAYYVYTYYKLSKVNFAFSKDKQDYKEAAIAIAMTPSGKMVLQLKQYTLEPPFGENLFMLYEGKFDPEVMGFASLFEKQ